MQTKHQIELTHQELKDVCTALEGLLHDDYATVGRATFFTMPGEELALAKANADRHIALRNRLRDQEFDIWKRELDDAHFKADADEAARYADAEPADIE